MKKFISVVMLLLIFCSNFFCFSFANDLEITENPDVTENLDDQTEPDLQIINEDISS
jgi:hypothetical protein